jgi:hypothetical protein
MPPVDSIATGDFWRHAGEPFDGVKLRVSVSVERCDHLAGVCRKPLPEQPVRLKLAVKLQLDFLGAYPGRKEAGRDWFDMEPGAGAQLAHP